VVYWNISVDDRICSGYGQTGPALYGYCKFKEKELGSMRFTISGKNIEVTEGLKSAVTEKLGKLERYFTPETEIHVTLSVEKERQKIEVTIPVKGNIIRSEQVSNDMYVSIDLVEEVIERQLRKYKTKIIERHQNGGNFKKEFIEKEVPEEEEVKIIRTKHFGMKPMFPEDACVQMELLGHNFFVFSNAETGEVNVVYKRKGNTYGLIEPEF
jgi:putative sigma-54 modulation protein